MKTQYVVLQILTVLILLKLLHNVQNSCTSTYSVDHRSFRDKYKEYVSCQFVKHDSVHRNAM
jgi:hypothetical protein